MACADPPDIEGKVEQLNELIQRSDFERSTYRFEREVDGAVLVVDGDEEGGEEGGGCGAWMG